MEHTGVPPAPHTWRSDTVETLHGTDVADPYRWLEADTAEVTEWVAAQNHRTGLYLEQVPGRPELRERLGTLLRAGSSVGCSVAGASVFSLDRWGPHEQAMLMVRSALSAGSSRMLVDPAERTGDPTAAVDWYHPSPDGRLVAYGLSRSGDELSTLHVVEVATGAHLAEEIPHTRAASVAWMPDGSAFAYTRYPEPGTVPDEDLNYWRTVWWHRLGEHWRHDTQIWAELPDRAAWSNVSLSPDGRWLLIHVSIGWRRVDVHLLDRTSGVHTAVIKGIDANSEFTFVDDRLVGITNLGADRGRVVEAPLRAAWYGNWRTIIAESDLVLESLVATSRSLLVLSSLGGVARLSHHDHSGRSLGSVELPEPGSLAGLSGSRLRDEAFLSFTSFTRPASMFRWRPGELNDWSRLWVLDPIDGPHGDYTVTQVTYPSPDGTEVPMFLVHATDTVPSTDTPCVLSGYGGFAITLAPTYSAAVVALCDLGAVCAVANVRGGSELGEHWHRAGMRESKQNSFDDFAAAADWLVRSGWTSRERLAMRGGSNGGLLVGATITQRPDICRAAHMAVPVLDMLRYHLFLIARLWIPEYGDPDTAEEFAWLASYSPYHAVTDGVCYPAVLATTAEHDSRVHPMHARKMVARLQAASSCEQQRPALLRSDTNAGHGQGKPVGMQAEDLADSLGFLASQIGLEIAAHEPPLPRPLPATGLWDR